MIDRIVITASLNVLTLWGIDKFDLHSFELESILTLLNAILMIYLHRKDK